ncbi:MAG: DAK2 domain-containing protein [Dehalococcoidales bacterium]
MKQVSSLGGQELRDMFIAATDWLEKSALDIDALNVFPVPDGDTGTNMLLTMRSTIEEAYRAPDHSASAVSQAIATGALMGARGNSGVILSQIWRGVAQSLAGKGKFTGSDLADALQQASAAAYKGINNPVEGTILTVAKDAAAAAQEQAASGSADLIAILEAVVSAASKSVANTPNLLDVLKDAGVVDAGGQGLYTILEGALYYLRGDMEVLQTRKPDMVTSDIPLPIKTPQMMAKDEEPYGYCTEFLLKGQELDPDKLRKKLEKKGQSLIVVGDESTVRVHIHTLHPGKILHDATSLGTVHQISIRNMDEQHQDYLGMQKDKMPAADIGVVAVVAGDGLTDVFTSLGVTAIVPGGQTMNPSTKDLLRAVEAVPSDKVVILPNNKNIVPTANQVHSLTEKVIEVIATETIPQGITALLAFNSESDLETNARAMNRAKSSVRSIAVTRAVRDAKLGELDIKKKQAIGFLEKDLVAAGDSTADVLAEVLARAGLDEAEVVTIYYKGDAEKTELEPVIHSIREQYPELEIELVQGGQPHYHYIASVE